MLIDLKLTETNFMAGSIIIGSLNSMKIVRVASRSFAAGWAID